ncbi:MAG: hypothetical protein VXY83_04040 [Pseudomonadota bacterium]|nr:hypothetical protein [Pseudomonadota bacterium]
MGSDQEAEVCYYQVPEIETIARETGNQHFMWQTPKRWRFDPNLTPLQDALFYVPAEDDRFIENDYTTAYASVSFLQMPFDLNSNLKRWQKQLAEDESQVSTHLSNLNLQSGAWRFVKLTTGVEASLIAVHESGLGTLFLKLTGPQTTVLAQAENFVQFVESVRLIK